MFGSKTPREQTGLQEAIDKILREMKPIAADQPEYAKMSAQLKRLYKLQELDKPARVSPDTIVLVAGNLVVAVLIVGYERSNVVASKALNFMQKLR